MFSEGGKQKRSHDLFFEDRTFIKRVQERLQLVEADVGELIFESAGHFAQHTHFKPEIDVTGAEVFGPLVF